MYPFSFQGYLIMATVLFLCFVALIFFRSRIKGQIAAQADFPYKRHGLFFVVSGVILVLASLTGYLTVRADIVESPQILQPVTSMTSEPVLLLLVSGFLVGLTAVVLGILYFSHGRSLRRQKQVA